MSQAASPEEGGAHPANDLWQTLLRETAAKSKIQDSSLFVFGDRCSGKNSLLKRMRFRLEHDGAGSESPTHQFPEAMAFSYFTLFDPDDPDSDSLGLPTKVNVWATAETKVTRDLLPVALGASDLRNTLAIVIVDLSQPHNAVASLQKWFEHISDCFGSEVAKLSVAEQKELKHKVQSLYSRKTATQADDDQESKDDAPADDAGTKDDEPTPSVRGEVTVENNVGIPIVVVGTQSDYLIDQRVRAPLTADQCDFLQMHLRRLCLQYGAALCYTSTVREAANCSTLQRYILHRLYPTQYTFAEKPEIIQKDSVFVPAGWDTPKRIDEIVEDGSTVSRDAAFSSVFKPPAGASSVTDTLSAPPSEPTLNAVPYQDFLKKLGVTVGSPGQKGEQDTRTQKKVAFLMKQTKNRASAKGRKTSSASNSPRRMGKTSDGRSPTAGDAAAGSGEPDHSLLRNFFKGLMNRTDRVGGAAGSAPKSSKSKKAPTK